jgi:hypothetical protein
MVAWRFVVVRGGHSPYWSVLLDGVMGHTAWLVKRDGGGLGCMPCDDE